MQLHPTLIYLHKTLKTQKILRKLKDHIEKLRGPDFEDCCVRGFENIYRNICENIHKACVPMKQNISKKHDRMTGTLITHIVQMGSCVNFVIKKS